jgi:hypothetical protein
VEVTAVDWEKLLAIYGPLGAFSGLFGYLIWRYVPRVVDNHVQFTDSIKDQGERATNAIEKLTDLITSRFTGDGEEYRDHVFSTHRTNKAINSMADAIQAGANELDQKVSNAVRPHVAAIKDAINSKNSG